MTMTPPELSAPANDEIDLRQLAAALQRHWRLIAKVAGGTLLASSLYAFLTPRVWEGEFQIVLASKDSPGSPAQALLQSNPGLAGLIGAKGGSDELKTEVKVLESPSVLKPVYDFVKSQKAREGKNVDRWRYSDWLKDNLSIELEKGTSVLNLAYRDTNKALVLPALDRISKEYQAYSGRDRERGISLAIKYLDEQIALYKTKSVASLRKAQQFAIEQDLTALKGEGQEDEIRNAINIEAIRVQAANEIRNLNEQQKQLDAIGDNPDALMYLGRTIPQLSQQGLPQTIDQIDTELALRQAKFTANDDSIRRLKDRRQVLIQTLRRQTYGYLNAKRTSAQARLAAAERPKGVLIQYRELLRNSVRDEATLTRLEAERQVLALEKARKQEPWELISKPTLLDAPVAPRKSRIMALGLLAGLVAGSGAALVVDRRSDLVFSEEELQQLLPGPLLAHLNPASMQGKLSLLARGALAGSHRVALIPAGLPTSNPQVKRVLSQLQEQLPHTELLCSSDLVQATSCDHQLLITRLGAPNRRELANLNQQLNLQNRPITGWLLLDEASAV